MSQPESWTVGRLLTWTTGYLKDRGAETPRLDAEVLLAKSLGCRRIELYTAFEDLPSDSQRAEFRELVRRRAEHEPVAYLVGNREFYSLSFAVTPDVLIPRPETEFVILALLDLSRTAAPPPAIADVGAGSGILAVCAAKHLPQATVTAIDISPAALQVARANASRHAVSDRITFVASDLFADVPPGRFDFILSNPPYVTDAEMAALPSTVRDHEPHLALAGGERGLDVIEPLIAQSTARLNPGGHLLMEISPMLEEPLGKLFTADPRWAILPVIKDLEGRARVIQARWAGE